MKNYTLAEINRSIPYIPVLRPYVGSVTACILMQQLDYWFSIKKGEAFYKFLESPKNEKPHTAYKTGDSWCEELFMSPDEFRGAFDKIGYRYKSYSEYRRAEKNRDPFQGHYYLSFHNKIAGLTWYLRNHNLVDSLLFEIFSRKSEKSIYENSPFPFTYKSKANLPKSGKSIPNISEITTDNTAENTTTEPASPVVVTSDAQYSQTLSNVLDQIPVVEHCSRLISAIEDSLTANGEGYTRSNIAYCQAKHRSNDGANSLGGMIVMALADDYAKAVRIKAADQVAEKARIAEERQQQDEDEKRRIVAETEEAKEWCATEEGKKFRKMLLSDDT